MMIGIKKIRLRIKWYLLAGVVFTNSLSLHAQKGRNITITNVKTKIQDNSLEIITEDSCTVINLIASYIRPELRKNIWQDIDKTRKYIYQAMAIARRIKYEQGIHDLRRCLGSAYTSKGPQDSARHYLRYSIKQMEDRKDTARLCHFLIQYARSCWYDSKYDTAIMVMQSAALLYATLKDTANYVSTMGYLPKFYMENGDFVQGATIGLEVAEHAIRLKDTATIVENYNYLSTIYGLMGLNVLELDAARSALKYAQYSKYIGTWQYAYTAASDAYYHNAQFDSAIHYARANTRMFPGGGQNISDLTVGSVYLDLQQLDSAEYYIQHYIDASNKYQFRVGPEAYFLLGECAFSRKQFDNSLSHFHKAEAELKPQEMMVYRKIFKSLYKCYDHVKEPAKAHIYLKKFTLLEDSMNLSRKTFAVALIESKKNAEKLNEQIQFLTSENQLQSLLASNQRLQRNVVFGSSFVFVCLTGLWFYRYRKQRELKSKQALLNERLRISRELHDEVGSTLSGIAMYSHVAREQVKHARQEEADESLTMMQKSAGEMVHKLSDIVWLIHPEHNTIANLFERLEDFARQSAAAKNMQVIVDLPETLSDVHIPLEARRNIYLFCKEALNNAVKYSRGATLKLLVTQQRDSLIFSVSDDGCGFDSFTIRKGNGLVNLEKRAEEIGAQFRLVSRPGEGTSVELQYATVS